MDSPRTEQLSRIAYYLEHSDERTPLPETDNLRDVFYSALSTTVLAKIPDRLAKLRPPTPSKFSQSYLEALSTVFQEKLAAQDFATMPYHPASSFQGIMPQPIRKIFNEQLADLYLSKDVRSVLNQLCMQGDSSYEYQFLYDIGAIHLPPNLQLPITEGTQYVRLCQNIRNSFLRDTITPKERLLKMVADSVCFFALRLNIDQRDRFFLIQFFPKAPAQFKEFKAQGFTALFYGPMLVEFDPTSFPVTERFLLELFQNISSPFSAANLTNHDSFLASLVTR